MARDFDGTIQMLISPMSMAEVAGLAAMEAENPGAWSAAQLAAELESDTAWHFVGRESEGSPVAAFVCGRLVLDEAEIFRLTVRGERRRRGLGRILLSRALVELVGRGMDRCFLEVRAANAPALALYRQCGFTPLFRRAAYYANPLDDAIIMVHNAVTIQQHPILRRSG